MSRIEAAIAATRFGMGARVGEIDSAAAGPREWLRTQIRGDAALISKADLKSAQEILQQRFDVRSSESATMSNEDLLAISTEALKQEIQVRLRHAARSADSFAERWARFWSNHFTVAARNAQMVGLVGPYEREAIRPHVFAAFPELLKAAVLHPAMLVYLDAAISVGPSSPVAQRRQAGLNENLAREILELHTLGVGAGYTQADIIEFAKALTGWTISGLPVARRAQAGYGGARQAAQRAAMEAPRAAGLATFVSLLHEPGARTLLGRRYAGDAEGQAAAMLDALARHPATARHVANKLARHFVADEPTAAAVSKLEAVFLETGGDLAALAHAVIDLDEAWGATQRKFKTPEELVVSVARAAGGQAQLDGLGRAYAQLGMRPFSAPSPAGWADTAEAWAGADPVMKRLEWASAISLRMARGASPSKVLDWSLGELAGNATRQAIARAESAEQGFTLLIMSPEFQRR